MKILIDARLAPNINGGIQQAIIGLAESFKYSQFADLQVCWLLYRDSADWLREFLSESDELFLIETPKSNYFYFSKLLTKIRKTQKGDKFLTRLRHMKPFRFQLSAEPEIVKHINPDVIHFPIQNGFKTERPNIYQPHDLQHLTLPDYFSAETLLARNEIYGKMIQQATFVIVGNEWTRKDVVNAYPDAAFKVVNVPVMPQLSASRDIIEANSSKRIELIYPASFWIHKNHKNLFCAIRLLRDRNYDVHLVCTGARILENEQLQRQIEKLGLFNVITLLGFVPRNELENLYACADVLVMPSFFESESLPIWEAFSFGIPVAASNVTAIPSQIADAGVLFDPNSPHDIARALADIISNSQLADSLATKGRARLSNLTYLNTLSGYRTYYRLAAGDKMDEIDSEWLKNGFIF